ncbi:NupC/NupG family nucleoside CNT transporter [Leptolyngbya sp. NK1-12]|uniref:NupC/NupG family nucleoside CNT transporter n=1 Tax=Leptolyngbya sp. NK1-12 TaxID=2547451 RepID=A0AA96WE75_9CYAN|nr:NupC/NupG family nucleoside CNT transporter [Leptolyngbya sp. NK1-12]
MERFISLIGIFVFFGLAYLLSVDRRAIRWRPVIWGFAIQFLFGLFVLLLPVGFAIFSTIGNLVTTFLNFSDVGAEFVYGENFAEHFFAFKVMSTVIFFSGVISLLYYFGILQKVVAAIASVMRRTMKTSGPETTSCSANIFIGQTEAPLLIRPFVGRVTLSAELDEELRAVKAKAEAEGVDELALPKEAFSTASDPIAALAEGAIQGVQLVLSIIAILIVFLSLIALINAILGWAGGLFGFPQLSLELILSYLLFPLAWVMGVPLADCSAVAVFLGKKIILNEFIAYSALAESIKANQISARAAAIATFALCGFANISSIGQQIGAIGGMVPSRRNDVARLGPRAMIAGSLTNFVSACIAGLLLGSEL